MEERREREVVGRDGGRERKEEGRREGRRMGGRMVKNEWRGGRGREGSKEEGGREV